MVSWSDRDNRRDHKGEVIAGDHWVGVRTVHPEGANRVSQSMRDTLDEIAYLSANDRVPILTSVVRQGFDKNWKLLTRQERTGGHLPAFELAVRALLNQCKQLSWLWNWASLNEGRNLPQLDMTIPSKTMNRYAHVNKWLRGHVINIREIDQAITADAKRRMEASSLARHGSTNAGMMPLADVASITSLFPNCHDLGAAWRVRAETLLRFIDGVNNVNRHVGHIYDTHT